VNRIDAVMDIEIHDVQLCCRSDPTKAMIARLRKILHDEWNGFANEGVYGNIKSSHKHNKIRYYQWICTFYD